MALVSLFVCVLVAVVVGSIILLLHPPPAHFPSGPQAIVPLPPRFAFGIGTTINGTPVGIGPQRWNIPGTIIGCIVGISMFWFLVRATRN